MLQNELQFRNVDVQEKVLESDVDVIEKEEHGRAAKWFNMNASTQATKTGRWNP